MKQNEQRKLPTLEELHYDVNKAFQNDQLNLLLNQPPNEKWLKRYPAEMGIVGGGSYLPIDKVDFLLNYIFQEWYPEILREGVMFHSVYVIVRLHYKNPLTGEWSYKDGCGAVNVQTDKGKAASDLAAIKPRAVQIALPIAKQQAKKDAAEELGALFGRDLNRKEVMLFAGAYGDTPPNEPAANGHDYETLVNHPTNGLSHQPTAATAPIPQNNLAFNPNDL